MKYNVLFLLTLISLISITAHAQRGVRIGYIDTEFILENIPEYQDATAQLNTKAGKWKMDIDEKLNAISQKRKDLSNEKALLTKELIDEREEDISFEEKEILDYQQKRFGPNGDLFIQKKQLMQPIQDQIFQAVQDIADSKQYDFIFDKSSDAVMLYSDKRFDLSEQIIRSITRSSKRTQAESKAERKAANKEELIPEINSDLEAREKELEAKKIARDSVVDSRKQEILDARANQVKAAEERRQKILEAREKLKQEKLEERKTTDAPLESNVNDAKTNVGTKVEETKTRAELIEENRQQKLAEREARMKELQVRKKKILEDRQKAKDSINNNK